MFGLLVCARRLAGIDIIVAARARISAVRIFMLECTVVLLSLVAS
jgi:hypothetical protein